jgi:hypothetical protein
MVDATRKSREFPTDVLLSITTGRMLCKFDDMHEACEFIAGYPIWTHEFADKALVQWLRDAVLAQHPDLAIDAGSVTPDNWKQFLDEQLAKLGASRTVLSGIGQRTESPIQSAERLMNG